jgi:hypothetical protein
VEADFLGELTHDLWLSDTFPSRHPATPFILQRLRTYVRDLLVVIAFTGV